MGRYFFYIIWKIWNLVFTSFNYFIQRSVSGSNDKSKRAKEIKKGMNHEFMYMNKNVCNGADKNKKSESSDNRKKYHLLSSQ
jgi:hypothetical protein